MRCRQATVDRDCLAIYIRSCVAQQEARHLRNFFRHAVSSGGIDLTDARLATFPSGAVENGRGHAGFDQAGADAVNPNAGAVQLVGDSLDHADNGCLACAVIDTTGIGSQTRDTGGADDRSVSLFNKTLGSIFDTKKSTHCVNAQRSLPVVRRQFAEWYVRAADSGVGVNAIQTLSPSWKLLYGVKVTSLDDEIEDSPVGQDDTYTVVNFGAAYSF